MTMTFVTVNGFRDSITREHDAIQKFRASMEHVMHSPTVTSLAREIMISLAHMHNLLQRGTGIGEKIDIESLPDRPSMISELRKNEYLERDLLFVLGAAHDPFLYSSDMNGCEGFQQGAVLNLRKAQHLLKGWVETITK